MRHRVAQRQQGEHPIGLHSAGGIVVQGRGEELRVAVMRSRYGTWVFPKGGVEKAEGPEGAARRELSEEIGLTEVEPRGFIGTTQHEFEREGRCYRKRVDWFLFEAKAGVECRANPEENALDCGWFGPQQALSLLSHPDQRRVLRRALRRLS